MNSEPTPLRRLTNTGLASLLIFSCSTWGVVAAGFTIARQGRPRAEIVVPNNPQAPLAFAAGELQRYVREMSGGELPIVHASSRKNSIVLTDELHAGPAGAQADPRDEDRYRISIAAGNLRVEGRSPRAVLFGVYDLLERLGCGWCVPGDDTIPKKTTLRLNLPASGMEMRPAFQYRMLLDFPLMSVAQTIAIQDWIAKNRMNWIRECPNAHGEPSAWYERRERVIPEIRKRGLHLIVGGHTMHTWLPETEFTAHPQWFAYHGGERKPRSLCLRNAEMTPVLIRNMQRFLDRCPEVEVIDLWHPDGEVFCHCAKCTRGVAAEGMTTNQLAALSAEAVRAAYVLTYVEFVNQVAAAIARSHPKVMVGPLIYSQTDRAMPDEAPMLADNVLMGVAHFFRDSYRPLLGEPKSAVNLRFLGMDLTWMAKAKHFYVYEYYNGWTAPYVYPGAQVIVRDLQTLSELQVPGVSSDMYGYTPINMYVAARALWSPSLSWKDAVRDYCVRYFGDVAEEMAENAIQLELGIWGLNGYQANGARDPESPTRPESGRFLETERPGQVAFLKKVIAKTKDPRVRARLERELQPWSEWSKEPRFWAFPEFKDGN